MRKITKKAAGIAAAAVISASAIGMGGVYAVGQIAQNNSIGAEAAQNFAFLDAGVMPEDAVVTKNKFDYDDGLFIYKVEFVAGDTFYEYKIKAADGAIVEKEAEIVGGTYSVERLDSTPPGDATIGLTEEEALEKALAEAGLSKDDVVVTKNKLDRENGRWVYEIEFYHEIDNNTLTEYEFDIDVTDGTIVSRSVETEKRTYVGAGTEENGTLNDGTGNAGGSTQQSSSGASSQGNGAQGGNGAQNGGNSQTTGNAGTGNSASGGAATQPPAQQTTYISAEQAKSAALSRAGVSAQNAVFTKTKLDHEDGRMVYEIEFYVGTVEYEVDVDAVSGAVVKYEMEEDDDDHDHHHGSTQQTPPSAQASISLDQAKNAAFARAGVNIADAVITKAKMDFEDGRLVFEIEFKVGRMEYEVEVDAASGTIIKFEQEMDD